MSFDVEALGRVELVDPEGRARKLGQLWADAPHVLLFLRHFG